MPETVRHQPSVITEPESSAAAHARFHVVLHAPEIAGNVGAIGRTCVAAGAMLWLVRPLGFVITDKHIRRAGLDYWQHLVYREVDSLDEVAEAIGPDRFWYFSTQATTEYTEVAYQEGDALVFGTESRGLPQRLIEANPGRLLRIPIRPEARSLNLSNCAAIGLYEATRQISRKG